MSNSYFQFKQFRVEQDQCAMKVSTDACIQGAWTPIETDVKRVLDAGTGTGLLSLMLAQRNNDIEIDAIELDEKAARQAGENITASPWADRIRIITSDVRSHTFDRKYDLIICNPPFFQNSLLGDSTERNNARHTLSLNYKDIIGLMEKVLSQNGYASVLLPFAELEQWTALLSANKWKIRRYLAIQPRGEMKPNRVIVICSRKTDESIEEKLVIYRADKKYTEYAVNILSPFYLNL